MRFKTIAAIMLSTLGVDSIRVALASSGESFDSNGVKIHYTVEGKGDPIILIHGLTSSAFMNWAAPGMIGLLAKDHQVIAMDVRGHGASDRPDKEAAYGTEMVEDVVRLMEHLQIKKAHIAGYSMGGMIAMKFIVMHPDRVLSGALCGMGWLKPGGLMEKIWDRMGTEGAGGPGLAAKSFGKLGVTEAELIAVKVPMTVLVGDRDPCRLLYVQPLKTVRPDWPVVEITGAGHIDCVVSKQFKDEMQKWISKQPKQ